jgi:hypothetical protein
MIKRIPAFLVLLVFLPTSSPGQGFGTMVKSAKTVTLQRLLPAVVNLNQKRIRVEATVAIHSIDADIPVVLKTKLVTAIQRDPRFIIDETRPETILHFTVTNYYVESRQTTTGTGAGQVHCTAFTGKLEASYQALEASTGAPLDSENLVYAITTAEPKKATGGASILKKGLDPFGSKKGGCGTDAKSTQHEAQDELVDQIVKQMQRRATPSEDPVVVPLPGGKLEPLSSLAISARWGKLEEDATKAEKFAKPEDDAYRMYLVALAQEAQAYDLAREAAARETGKDKSISPEEAEASFQRAQKLLDEARKNYKDALTAKSSEKEFRVPDDRMEKAIQVYAVIQRHKEEYQKFLQEQQKNKPQAKPPATTEVSKVSKPAEATAAAKPAAAPAAVAPSMDKTPLAQVTGFCLAGLDAISISDYIKDPQFLEDAKRTNYKWNFGTDPLALKQACGDKSAAIQKMIRDRLAATAARRTP